MKKAINQQALARPAVVAMLALTAGCGPRSEPAGRQTAGTAVHPSCAVPIAAAGITRP